MPEGLSEKKGGKASFSPGQEVVWIARFEKSP